jgi:hypothetical protein
MVKIAEFIVEVQKVYGTGIAREHAYRPILHGLFSSLNEDVTPVNDPAKTTVGAPDFILLRGGVPIGHVEAKDIGIGIRGMKDTNKSQQERYRSGFNNLIYTNCVDLR